MQAHQRLTTLRDLLENEGAVVVSDLARDWEVSEMTVRRDLQRLEAEGLAERIHGGAVAAGALRFAARHDRSRPDKTRAAQKFVDVIPARGCIYLDGSTTIYQLVAACDRRPGLRVATANIDTFQGLAGCAGIEPILIGGTLDRETDNFVGPLARRTIAGLNFDAAFFSAYALSPEGPSEPSLEDAEIKAAVVARSRRHYLAIDHRKLGQRAAGAWELPAAHAVLATDCEPGDERLTPYRAAFQEIR